MIIGYGKAESVQCRRQAFDIFRCIPKKNVYVLGSANEAVKRDSIAADDDIINAIAA